MRLLRSTENEKLVIEKYSKLPFSRCGLEIVTPWCRCLLAEPDP
jgi:hypothetical protein